MMFELDRLPDYSDEALLDELRRVAKVVGTCKLTIAEFSNIRKQTSGRFAGDLVVGMVPLKRQGFPICLTKFLRQSGHTLWHVRCLTTRYLMRYVVLLVLSVVPLSLATT